MGKTSVLPIFLVMIQIPFTQLQTGHILVQLEIAKLRLSMIVDTGASNTVISTDVAERLGLQTVISHEPAVGAGSAELEVYTTDALSVAYQGQMIYPSFSIMVMNMEAINTALSKVEDVEVQVQGLLGADFLTSTSAVIDYGAEVMRIIG